MLDFNAPFHIEQESDKQAYRKIYDSKGFFVQCTNILALRAEEHNQFALILHSPELYAAAKEMIDLKNKLWYQGLDEIEQGVFNSVLAKLEITIDKIEKEAANAARVNN